MSRPNPNHTRLIEDCVRFGKGRTPLLGDVAAQRRNVWHSFRQRGLRVRITTDEQFLYAELICQRDVSVEKMREAIRDIEAGLDQLKAMISVFERAEGRFKR